MPEVMIISITHFTPVGTDIGNDPIYNFDCRFLQNLQFRHLFPFPSRKAERSHYFGIEYN